MADHRMPAHIAEPDIDRVSGDDSLRQKISKSAGDSLIKSYLETGLVDDLEKSITISREVIGMTPQEHPEQKQLQNDLAIRLGYRYSRMGGMGDLKEAIRIERAVIEGIPSDHPQRCTYLNNLGALLGDKYAITGLRNDLEEAIHFTQQGVESCHRNPTLRAALLCNLGARLGNRYSMTGTMIDLEEAIRVGRKAVEELPKGHHDRTACANSLGIRLSHRFCRTGRIDDLQESIELGREVLKGAPQHLHLAERLNNLGVRLGYRYSRTGAAEDLSESIRLGRKVLQTSLGDHPYRPAYLNNLGNRLGDEYSRTGDIEFLGEAIRYAEQAVEKCSEGHPNRAAWMNDHGILLGERFTSSGKMEDLREAINIGRQVVRATELNHPDYAARLNNLGSLLADRFSRIGEESDLEDAINVGQEALVATPQNHPDRAAFLNNLGLRLSLRHSRTGSMDDLEAAIKNGGQAVDATPLDHPERAGRMVNLGALLGKRFLDTGALDDLGNAIKYERQALKITPPSHPRRSVYFNNLSLHLKHRYLRTQMMDDLQDAIELGRQAVDTTPLQHPNRVRRLDNLGDLLGRRYSRTRQLCDLEEAILIEQEVIQALPEDHPDRPACLNNLGIRLSDRFSRKEQMSDLEEAIQIGLQAVHDTPQEHPSQAGLMNNIGFWLGNKFSKSKVMSELHEAICYAKRAVGSTPEGHPARAGRLTNLGVLLGILYCRTRTEEHLEESVTCFNQALASVSSPVLNRIYAGILSIHYLGSASAWRRAYETATVAIDLIRLLSPQSLQNSDKQYVLSQIAGFSSDAAAVALQAGEGPLRALNFLEQGRGVLAASLEEMRTDVEDLQREHPLFAAEFFQLRNELSGSTTSGYDDKAEPSTATRLDNRYRADEDLHRLLINIRNEAGFERFLLPPSEATMLKTAERGPIVVVNMSKYRCDAILVQLEQITSVALLPSGYSTIESKAKNNDLASPQVLEWLWDEIAEPILRALGVTEPPSDDKLPHIWWIPTGPLAKFPLHATGRHGKFSSESVLDRVMSSYSSSVKAVIRARQLPFALPSSALVLAMDNTPGCCPLPFASKELDMLRDVCKSMAISIIEPGRSVNDIMSQMLRCGIFHFAGHGHTDDQDPSESNLVLEDGKLMVSHLLERNLRESQPFLAYLSACGTGRIRNERFYDESINLIGAFQSAGFRHVIGTLWEVNDELCVDVARMTYEGIRDGGMTDESVCLALHKAVKELRDISYAKRTSMASGRLSRTGGASTEARVGAHGEGKKDVSDGTTPRDIVLCDDDEMAWLSHWVPYVHFGI